MAITQYDPESGYMMKRFRDASGRLMPIERSATGSILPQTTQIGQSSSPIPGREMVKYNPFSMNNIMNTIKNPAALRTLGLIPGLGVGAGLLGAGSLAYSLMTGDSGEPISNEALALKMREASDYSWGKRALDPTTQTTVNNESVRTAHDKHSKTGKWIVYPTIRSVNGKLKELGNEAAKKQAEELNDFIKFDKEEDALAFSQYFSSQIGIRRDRKMNQGLLM